MADGHRKHRCFSASSGIGEADRFMELFFLTMPASFRTLQSDFESRLKAGTLGTRKAKAADFTSGFQFANAFILVRWAAQNDSMAPFQRLKPGSGGVRGVCFLRVRTNRVFHGSWVAPFRKHPGSNLNYKLLRKRVLYQQQVLQRRGFYTDTHKGIRNNARERRMMRRT